MASPDAYPISHVTVVSHPLKPKMSPKPTLPTDPPPVTIRMRHPRIMWVTFFILRFTPDPCVFYKPMPASSTTLAEALHDAQEIWHIYEQSDEQSDLEAAIQAHMTAVALCPQSQPGHGALLGNLGTMFLAKYRRTRDLADFDTCINFCADHLKRHPNDDERFQSTLNLGQAYGLRSIYTSDPPHRDIAVCYLQELLESPSLTDARRTNVMGLLSALEGGSRQSSKPDRADDSSTIIADMEARLARQRKGDPSRETTTEILAQTLKRRFDQEGSMDDLSSLSGYSTNCYPVVLKAMRIGWIPSST